ncbi:MAG: hypothetical protein H0W64_06680 [Gammaproteobacteria bacterium]|nr:hypothetical protein [Gammaproteobacteria bacterium]
MARVTKRLFLLCWLGFFYSTVCASPVMPPLRLQVIQSEMVFDSHNIAKASITRLAQGGIGVLLTLKQPFGDDLQRMTYDTVGKKATLTFGDRVISLFTIQSPLSYQLLLTGFSQNEAMVLVQSLNKIKANQNRRQNAPSLLKKLNEAEPKLIQIR